jgi:hypothetical protein
VTATNRRALVLALGAVALCLLVIGLLVRPRDDPPPAPATATSETATTGSVAVVATPKVGAVEFSWSDPAQTSTDTFRVQVGPTADEAQIADPVTLTKATYSVKTSRGGQVCLVVAVVRHDQTSPASPAACGTAG